MKRTVSRTMIRTMTRFLAPLAIAALTMGLLATELAAADLSGVWTLRWEPDFGGNFDAYDCTVKQDGRILTVKCHEDRPTPAEMTGEVDGQKAILRFKTGRDDKENATLTGDVDQRGTTITGTWHLVEQNRDGKFVLKKQ